MPRALGDLGAHEFIGLDAALDDVPQVKWLRRAVPGLSYAIRANATTAQALACAEGYGIALLPTFMVAREPRLLPVLARSAGPTRDLWAVIHGDMRRSARSAVVLEWLARAVPPRVAS